MKARSQQALVMGIRAANVKECVMKYTELGERIAYYRFETNQTQTELAKAAGLSLAIVQKIKQGVVDNPRLATLRSLAQALGVRVVDLLLPDAEAQRPKRPTWPVRPNTKPAEVVQGSGGESATVHAEAST